MDDTQMLDWVGLYVVGILRLDHELIELIWIDKEGFHQVTEGLDIRDCIRGAIISQREGG